MLVLSVFVTFFTRVLPSLVSRLHSCPVWAIGRSSLYLKVQRPDLLRHFVADMENFDLFDQKVINMIQHDSVIMQVYDHLSLEVICDDNANCAVLNLLCHMEMDDSTLCSVVLSQSLGGSSCHILPCLRQCGWSFLSYGVSLACGPFAMELKLLRTCSAAFATGFCFATWSQVTDSVVWSQGNNYCITSFWRGWVSWQV